jgi:hypothetical protein
VNAEAPDIPGKPQRPGDVATDACVRLPSAREDSEQRDHVIGAGGLRAARVGQAEGGLAVAAIRGSDQLEERVVFTDRQELPMGKCPAYGREVAGEESDLTDHRARQQFSVPFHRLYRSNR